MLDKDHTKHTIAALADKAIDVLSECLESELEPKVVTMKDKLQAANMLFTLADMFPNKRKEITFLTSPKTTLPFFLEEFQVGLLLSFRALALQLLQSLS